MCAYSTLDVKNNDALKEKNNLSCGQFRYCCKVDL